jgi:hypothetical protein
VPNKAIAIVIIAEMNNIITGFDIFISEAHDGCIQKELGFPT